MTVLFSDLLFNRTYEIDHYCGRTKVSGIVYNVDSEPIEDVVVICSNYSDRTDINGKFDLDGVPEGFNVITFYGEGYFILELGWLCYPMKEIKDTSFERSLNNISNEYEIILYNETKELFLNEIHGNGSLELTFNISDPDLLPANIIKISNGTGWLEQIISKGWNSIILTCNGSFELRVGNRNISGYHPVNNRIDLTEIFDSLNNPDQKDYRWNGSKSMFVMNISGPNSIDINIMIAQKMGGYYHFEQTITSSNNGSLNRSLYLAPGIYEIQITGREITDVFIRNVIINSTVSEYLDIDVENGKKYSEFTDLSFRSNYYMSLIYMILGFMMMFGAFLARRSGNWMMILIIGITAFFTRGPFFIGIFNINSILSIILVLLLLFSREEFNKKRK